MRSRDVRLPAVLAVGLLGGALESEAAGRALVLDSASRAVLAIDLHDGRVAARLDLPVRGIAPEMFLTPDRSRLVVVDPGRAKLTWGQKLKPLAPSFVLLIDPVRLALVAETEVGWGVAADRAASFVEPRRSRLVLSPDGERLSVYCAGYDSKKPEERHPREIVTLGLAGGHIESRMAIDRPLDGLEGLPSGRLVGFAAAREADKDEPAAPAELLFLDPQEGAVAQRTSLAGNPEPPLLSPDGQWLYLLDRGEPSGKPEKNVPGSLLVVSASTAALAATIEVGTAPRPPFADADHESFLLLSESGPSDRRASSGRLTVVRGAEAVARLAVVADPLFLRVRGDRVFVVGERAISEVDPAGWWERQQMPVQERTASELALSPDGKRGFVLFAGSRKLSVLDLERRTTVAHVGTGRGGVKFGKTLGAIAASMAATAASYGQGMAVAQTQGRSWFTYKVYAFSPGAVRTSLVVGPDGKYVYALNTQTKDVTIVDANSGTVVDKVACGGQALSLFGERGPLIVIDGETLRLLDTTNRKVTRELKFEDALRVELLATPDPARVVALGGRGFYVLDAASAEVVAQAPNMGHVAAVAFDPGETVAPVSVVEPPRGAQPR